MTTARSQLIAELRTRYEDYKDTAIFGGITNDKKVWNTSGACHGYMADGYNNTEKIISLIARHDELDTPYKEPYLHWLMNDSPYASAFISKSAPYALREGLITCTGHTPNNLLIGALQCTRRLWEDSWIPEIWGQLQTAGFNKNLAFFLACTARLKSGDSPDNYKFSLEGGLSDHHPLWTNCMAKKSITNFIHNKQIIQRSNYFKNTKYNDVIKTWGRDTLDSDDNFFPSFMLKNKIILPDTYTPNDWFSSEKRPCVLQDNITPLLKPFIPQLHKELQCAE